jgi:hypothetical protein
MMKDDIGYECTGEIEKYMCGDGKRPEMKRRPRNVYIPR